MRLLSHCDCCMPCPLRPLLYHFHFLSNAWNSVEENWRYLRRKRKSGTKEHFSVCWVLWAVERPLRCILNMLIQLFVMKIRSVLDEVLHLDRRTEMKRIGAFYKFVISTLVFAP